MPNKFGVQKTEFNQMTKTVNQTNSVNVNAHLHTPYSFSAFSSIAQALDMAEKEEVKIVGINDFYTTDGYDEWAIECAKRQLVPLFNIEFVGLQEEDQKAGILVNDPQNPGRTYLSGKGLRHPAQLKQPYLSQLETLREESNRHVERMCEKLNQLLSIHEAGFTLNFSEITKSLTKGIVRERHLAKALRMKVYEQFQTEKAINDFLNKLFNGKTIRSILKDHAAVENEIRVNLLKAGGAAFVSEDPKAFLPMETVRQIILHSGGLPTYPFLADDAKGGFTDFERNKEKAADALKQRGIFSVEFITTRNSIDVLEEYAGYFHDQGFVVTFGSEHNTPAMGPITLFARNNTPLSDRLKEINYLGACVIVAHQQLEKQVLKGYLNKNGVADILHRDEYIHLGNKIIKSILQNT
jgi:hypothetical protein